MSIREEALEEEGSDRETIKECTVISGKSRKSHRSHRSHRSHKTASKIGSESTIRGEDVPPSRSSVSKAGSETGRSRAGEKEKKKKKKEMLMIEEEPQDTKSRKSTTLSMLLKGRSRRGREERESVLSLRPKTIEM
jgi:hypothetical protein